MVQLNPDRNFHFELLRVLASARGSGADIAEILNISDQIEPGNFESWYENFNDLATWILSTLDPKHDYDKATLRDAYLRNHHCVGAMDSLFDKATAMMDPSPERRSLKADGFEVPVIFFRASPTSEPRPVLIIGNGLDGSMEEMFHFHGLQALEIGYHVVLYEGPGQCTVRRQQNLGFIHDWERVVTPVIDYLCSLAIVDQKRIGLLGNSLGGYLAARAAAFERRIAATILIDDLFDVYAQLSDLLPTEGGGACGSRERETVQRISGEANEQIHQYEMVD
ncbi:uncharacterized protein Z518_05676 [Rhinocladiella mackenziei CBS 650.93]|uniref:Rhinocladiella mackenziei CBS 650.93 unplaced genomic scaffold supercont1.4, whole genome shotgun sequence n=1 Tax=Rhinocladiella mackenziei CBS 650.93 TaxID=1442369 RepID=A0A0D2J6V6_9EURO|nr:uncharacterized protein Z518_05676 [Rhinocladiella mackenziei CBS 650.93]KIX04805.1 hypothetical protein Z518_05676 [Rhinocladiella mackenziei CBS 650.93]